MTTCPKCSYTRQPADRAPDYSCPSCSIVYAKYDAQADLARRIGRAAKTGNWSGVPPEYVPQQAPEPQQAVESSTQSASATRPVSIKARYDAMDLRITQRTRIGIDVWMLVFLMAVLIAWLFATQERNPRPNAAMPTAADLQRDQVLQALQALVKKRNDAIELAIAQRRVMVGMTGEQVQAAWGRPTNINRTVSGGGTREQWIYRRGRLQSNYVHLDDGVVQSFQVSEYPPIK